MIKTRSVANGLLTWAALAALGCGDDGSTSKSMDSAQRQTPPMGAAKLAAWLTSRAYQDWQCEEEPHAQRSPSPHSVNRICTNGLISDDATGSADWPEGAAAVKEIYAALGDAEPIGYAVYLKTAPDSAQGDNWYWYERVGDGKAVDGLGLPGCVGCHAAAGADAEHTPSPGGRDMVYTPLP